MRAALGFRAHTGWAASVAVGADGPRVVDRRRVDLFESRDVLEAEVFHRAADMALPAAGVLIDRARVAARRLAARGLDAVCAELAAAGHEVVAIGVVLGNGRLPDELESILRSHPLIHTAEGELYRSALVDAGNERGLPVTGVASKELYARASRELRVADEALRRRLVELGRDAGKPWAQDQKESALVAWLALASRPSRRARAGHGA